MIRPFLICCLAVLLLAAPACNRHRSDTQGRVAEAYLSDSASVVFDIAPLQSGNASVQWMASYTSQGKTARFRIEMGPAKASDAKDSKDFRIKSGEGRFMPEPGSDASVLLVDLKKALEAKVLPTKVQRSTSLPFTFVNLGENLSQASGGGFNEKPAGNWTAMKIFVGKGEQEGEVFLNLNPELRKGQFSSKDPDYGDVVLAELAKVL